jgi:hypothetical protein
VLAHESNKSRKLLLEIEKTGPSGFRNQTIQFCWDRQQSKVPLDFDKVLPLWPSDVWMKKMRKPRQPRRLERWLLDLGARK